MNRRLFFNQSSRMGVILCSTPLIALTNLNGNSFFKEKSSAFSPYKIAINEKQFQRLVSEKSIAAAIAKKAVLKDSDRNRWGKGEGWSHLSYRDDRIISIATTLQRVKVLTPVFLLEGDNEETNVYGQIFKKSNNNEIGIIRGFNNRYYCVFHNFLMLFMYKFRCYGLPASDYEVKECPYGGGTYVRQAFQTHCTAQKIWFYAWLKTCKSGSNGLPDGKTKIGYIEPCGIYDGLEMGQGF